MYPYLLQDQSNIATDIDDYLNHKNKYIITSFFKICSPLPQQASELKIQMRMFQKQYNINFSEDICSYIHKTNLKAIEKYFLELTLKLFEYIEPKLPEYKTHKNIKYLDTTICNKLSELDPEIFHNGYKLHKNKNKPMKSLRRYYTDVLDKMFMEIFDILNYILTSMRIYYGYEPTDYISEILYESILNFIDKNQNCFIATADRNSLTEYPNPPHQYNGDVPYDILLDVLTAIAADKNSLNSGSNKGILSQVKNLLKVAYNYAVSPALSYTYKIVKNINPFETGRNLTEEEIVNFRNSLVVMLNPDLMQEMEVEERILNWIKKYMKFGVKDILRTMKKKEILELENFLQCLDIEDMNYVWSEIVKEINKINITIAYLEQMQEKYPYKYYSGEYELYIFYVEEKDLFPIKVMILYYKCVENNYSAERRRLMLKVCYYKSVKTTYPNSIRILKFIYSYNLPYNYVLKTLRNMPTTYKIKYKKIEITQDKDNEKMEIKYTKNEISSSYKNKKDEKFDNIIQLYLYRIKRMVLESKEPVPLMHFDRLTPRNPKKVVTFVFSGFMSEDTCKIEYWRGILSTLYDSEVYSLRWESKSYGSVLDFAVDTIKDIASANLKIGILGSIGGPYIRAIAIMREIYKKYHANPFNPAFKSAEKTGIYMAYFLMNNFKGHLFNLIGFSLGTELIKNILKQLQKKNCLFMVNKIYFMGGLTDVSEMEDILKKSYTPITIINLYSQNDNVLKYLLKICKPSIVPAGLNPIPEIYRHNIRNRDCTAFINGHLDYRNFNKMEKFALLFNLKND